MKRIEKNIKLNYWYQCFRFMDITGAIWVLYLGFKGMGLMEIGILEGIFHMASLLFEIPTGAIADLLGRKKTILLGRMSSILSSLIMMGSHSFWGFAIGFIFSAVSYNLSSGTEEALVYDSLKEIGKEEDYLKINGKINFIIEVMQGIGAFIGALIAERSFGLSYGIGILTTFIAFILAFKFIEPTNNNLKEEVNVKRHFRESYITIVENKRLVFLIVFYPILFALSAVLYFYGQQYFGDEGYSKIGVAFIFLFNSIASGIGAIISPYIEKRLKKETGFIIGLLMAMGLGIFAISTKGWTIVVFCLVGFLTAILQPINSEEINEFIPSEQRATLISVQSMGYSLMMVLFFPIAGVIGELVGLRVTFMILGILMIGCIIVAYRIQKDYTRRIEVKEKI